jgi:signal transduction histidine kinase/ligand-binding sensor domain-containing protein
MSTGLSRLMLASLCALLLAANSALAATNSSAWLFRVWQTDEGLPDNDVSGVAQTPDGYLWVATYGGLERFDGTRFEEFPPANLPGVPNRVVRALTLDRRHRLWLGMDRGALVCAEPDAARAFTAQHGLPDARITQLVEDGEESIWVAYNNGGVSRLQDGRATYFLATNGLTSLVPCWLASDARGQLWFANGTNVGVFRDERFQTLVTLDEPAVRIGSARAGGVWIATPTRLLKFAEGGVVEEVGSPLLGRKNLGPRVLWEDTDGTLWFGTEAEGLFRREGGEFERVATSHLAIACVTKDREGNVWAGTSGGGLNRVRPRPLELIGRDAGLPFESVRSVSQDTNGRIWIVTQNGEVARQENGGWLTVSAGGAWPGGRALCVAADARGAVWIGTRDNGLHRLLDGQFRTWRKGDGLAGDIARSLLVSARGDVWLGVDPPTRLQRFREGEWCTFELPPGARSLRAMAEDANGTIWAGTADGQLVRVDGDALKSVPTSSPQERPLSIRSLHATPDGSVWIGYAGWGVGRLKDGRYQRIDLVAGLHDNYISQIVADHRGWLWFGGNRGIFQVRQSELADVAEGRAARVRSIAYGRSEGFPSLQANFEAVPGALRSRGGRIWFPMHTGLAVVRPETIRDNPDPPSVWLTRVAVDEAARALHDSRSPLRAPGSEDLVDLRNPRAALQLPPGHRKIDFEFAALSFTAPENVHFRYRLEGLDAGWTEAGPQRSATYSRLDAGDYQFHVIACNNTGVWNEAGAVLRLTVLPYFWQTWWFRSTTLTVFIVGVIALVRFVALRRLRLQMQRLEEQAALNRERARIARDIHDDLGADLARIGMLTELARQDAAASGKAGEHVQQIATTTRQVMQSLDEIVWAVNPRNDTLAHLIDYAGQFAVNFLQPAGVRCRLDFPDHAPTRELSTDVRHHLFLIVKEALHNVVKHARATEVWLRVAATDDALRIAIEDNGRGFDRPGDDPGADGLRNMKQRAARIGGECRIESAPGQGTKVNVELRWPALVK